MGLTGEGTTADELWELGSRDAIAEHLRDLADEHARRREAAEVGAEDWATVERFVLLRTIDSLWVEHLTELDDMRRGIGLRGYAQQDPLNEFKREAFRLYEELRGLIRHQVASLDLPGDRHAPAARRRPAAIRRVAASLARGAAALTGGNGPRAGAGAAAAVAAARRAPAAAAPPVARRCCAADRRRRPRADARIARRPAGRRRGGGGAGAAAPSRGSRPSGARIGRNDPCWCGSGAKYKKCHGR